MMPPADRTAENTKNEMTLPMSRQLADNGYRTLDRNT